MDNKVKEPVDSFVFLVCVVCIPGYFQGVFSEFLVVFPVLWLLGCMQSPSSLETSPCGIGRFPVLRCQHPEGAVTPVTPVVEGRMGEAEGIRLRQAKRQPAPEKLSQ